MLNNSPLIFFFRLAYCGLNKFEDFNNFDWDLLIRQARRANVLGRVACLLSEKRQLELVPEQPRQHLEGMLRVCAASDRSVKWEVRQLHRVLRKADIDFLLLKGAAYIVGDAAASKGRLFADVDILVRKNRLDEAESVLLKSGWMSANLDAYDQKYYRQWMHELPPMRHLKRHATLDIHHTIIPPTAAISVDIAKLWDSARKTEGPNEIYVLSLPDMILHSATHLFYEGEFDNGFRDITDLCALFDQFARQENGNWDQLVERARELDVIYPLIYALRYCAMILKFPIPTDLVEKLSKDTIGFSKLLVMDFLFIHALMPNHYTFDDRWTGLARWLLYIRAHWLRMPLHLLIPHLFRKAWIRLVSKDQH